jgi:hypothetical protein
MRQQVVVRSIFPLEIDRKYCVIWKMSCSVVSELRHITQMFGSALSVLRYITQMFGSALSVLRHITQMFGSALCYAI